jgi:hypothetical protein
VKNTVLSGLYGLDGSKTYDEQFSDASLESVMIYIVATASAALENIFDYFRRDVSRMVEQERYGHKGWYEAKARAYQHGDNLPNDDDVYGVTDSEKQIIKAAWCGDGGNGIVDLKVAKIEGGEFSKPDNDEITGFTVYINRIKPAGIFINVIAEDADLLGFTIDVYYNPMLMKHGGELISGGGKPVENAIDSYLKSLDFNGEFVTMKLVDYIQQAEGVEIVEVKRVQHNYLGYGWQNIDARQIPYSGFYKIDTTNRTINYKPITQ